MAKIMRMLNTLFVIATIVDSTTSSQIRPPVDNALVRLERDLFSDYLGTRPFRATAVPVEVEIELAILSLMEVDTKNKLMTVVISLGVSWYDHTLAWEPKNYDNIHSLFASIDKIWSPRISFFNAAGNSVNDEWIKNVQVKILTFPEYFAFVYYVTQLKETFRCDLELEYFPFDYQSCAIQVHNPIEESDSLRIVAKIPKILKNAYQENNAWSLLNTSCANVTTVYPYEGKNYSSTIVSCYLLLLRKSSYYISNIVVPCVILSFLSVLVFLLPHEDGERASLGITILLAFTVFQLVVADFMPRDSDANPLLARYLREMTLVSSAALLLSILSLRIYRNKLPARFFLFLARPEFRLRRSKVGDGSELGRDDPGVNCQKAATRFDVMSILLVLLASAVVNVHYLIVLPAGASQRAKEDYDRQSGIREIFLNNT